MCVWLIHFSVQQKHNTLDHLYYKNFLKIEKK